MVEVIKKFRLDVQNLTGQYHRPAIVFWMQAFWYFVRYGASPNDYIRYELYLKNGRGVNEYITALRHKKLIRTLNHEKNGELKENKYETNLRFKAYISRDWIKADQNSNIEEAVRFVKAHDAIVVKPLNLSGGKGIEKYVSSTISDVRAFVEKLKVNEFLIEEVVQQHEEMNVFNPHSVNTLRIFTLCDNLGKVMVVDAFVRMATREIIVDNFHSGGCAAEVDIATGIVISPAMDMAQQNIYCTSPITGETIIGRRIPSWSKAKAVCIEIAKRLFEDDKRYLAFDIAILENGVPELIEINWFGDPVIRQIIGCKPHGKYREIKKFL